MTNAFTESVVEQAALAWLRPGEVDDRNASERLGLLPAAQEHVLRQENGKERCVRAVRELSQSFALAVPHEQALAIRDDVAFFQAVQAVLAKRAPGEARPEEELDHAQMIDPNFYLGLATEITGKVRRLPRTSFFSLRYSQRMLMLSSGDILEVGDRWRNQIKAWRSTTEDRELTRRRKV